MDVSQAPTARDPVQRLVAAGANRGWIGFAWAIGATAACTLVGFAMRGRFDLVNIAMVYLLAVVLVALHYARGPAILTSVLCITAFDVLFVPPAGTITVDDLQYVFTFAIMLTVGLVISHLVAGVRRQAREQAALEVATETERIRSALLASISHDLRTPLAGIKASVTSLLADDVAWGPEDTDAFLRAIDEDADRLDALVANLLDMSRLQTGALDVDTLTELRG